MVDLLFYTIGVLYISFLVPFSNGLTIAITGTSQGIGLDAATRLISQGHTVIHACRSTERAAVAAQKSCGGVPMECDLASFKSIRTFASRVREEFGSLDVLCCNAGIAPSTRALAPELSSDGFEECLAVNHLGHFLLTNLLADLLEADGGGQLVVTASSVHDPDSPGGNVGGKGGATLGDLSGLGVQLDGEEGGALATMADGSTEYNGSKVYQDSKLANILFGRRALTEFSGRNISVRMFNPGFIPSSGLFRAPKKDNWFTATAFTVFAGLAGFAVPVDTGGARLAYMATAPEEEVPSGSYFSAEVGSRAFTKEDGFDDASVSIEASDDDLAARLWFKSTEIVGL